jgi:hypothetical protein
MIEPERDTREAMTPTRFEVEHALWSEDEGRIA